MAGLTKVTSSGIKAGAISGDGSINNPFKSLYDLKEVYTKGGVTVEGSYYFVTDTGSVQATVAFESRIGRDSLSEVWVKLDSNNSTLIKDTNITSASLSAGGVVTLSNIHNIACGVYPMTYVVRTPFHFKHLLFKLYRPVSIHQCIYVDTSPVVTNEVSGTADIAVNTTTQVSAPSYLEGSTTSFSRSDVNRTNNDYAVCAWTSDIFAFNTDTGLDDGVQEGATTTTYNYDYLTMIFNVEKATDFGIGFNCANENSIAQTGTTHEWWVSV